MYLLNRSCVARVAVMRKRMVMVAGTEAAYHGHYYSRDTDEIVLSSFHSRACKLLSKQTGLLLCNSPRPRVRVYFLPSTLHSTTEMNKEKLR